MDKKAIYINTPVGCLIIAEKDGKICEAALKGRHNKKESFTIEETPLLKEAARQLGEYFEGKRKQFDLPLLFDGTPFQVKVWRQLTKIPYGQSASYGKIAELIGSPKACRAVGMANNKNPIIIIVPCHRVIGADGKLIGFACGLDKKKFLLTLEKYFKD